MEQEELKRRVTDAEAAVLDASLRVRRQREHLTELKMRGQDAEAARAQAMLEILEDILRRRIADRNSLWRIAGVADLGEDSL